MDCLCEIDCEIDDWCEELESCFKKANKEHKCHECDKIIKRGDEYKYEKMKFEDKIFIHKTCLDCMSVRNEFFTNYRYGEIWEEFKNYINEVNGEISELCIIELTKSARDKVCDLIEEYWG